MACSLIVFLLFEVSGETATHVLPGGEGGGEGYLEFVFDFSYDEVVGVDVAGEPVVLACAVFHLYGYVGERLVDVAVHGAQFEADAEGDILLGYLHDALLALQPEG